MKIVNPTSSQVLELLNLHLPNVKNYEDWMKFEEVDITTKPFQFRCIQTSDQTQLTRLEIDNVYRQTMLDIGL